MQSLQNRKNQTKDKMTTFAIEECDNIIEYAKSQVEESLATIKERLETADNINQVEQNSVDFIDFVDDFYNCSADLVRYVESEILSVFSLNDNKELTDEVTEAVNSIINAKEKDLSRIFTQCKNDFLKHKSELIARKITAELKP